MARFPKCGAVGESGEHAIESDELEKINSEWGEENGPAAIPGDERK